MLYYIYKVKENQSESEVHIMREWFVEIKYSFFSGGFQTLTFKPYAESRVSAVLQARDAAFAMYGHIDGTIEVITVI